MKCENLMNQKKSIASFFSKQSSKNRSDYRIRLNSAIECSRFLLHQGLPFRGHDESQASSNQGNYLELQGFLARNNEVIKSVVLNEAPGRHKLTSPDIQKEITQAAAEETTSAIIKDLGDSLFSIMIDESRDISCKEQMAVVLRYVDKKGHIMERFLGIQHVSETTAISLKASIEALFATHGLTISRLRGQGYDGASNMQGEFNDLKALILRDNPTAYFVHCFAHQLQLALIGVTKNHNDVGDLFNFVTSILNVVGGSCKRRDILRDKQEAKIIEALEGGEISSGRGLNQETTLRRHGDTRWGSHYLRLSRWH
ncbi:zinc finger MYM-type protein 1-like [Tripterygium wilfordii]|uniref:zinc finger MYM-type protein 1-like n=1 Tax=Tripterygium wilfordii TaxID=458696 RepID=UPI0018F8403F|nr:zinc finger MYM-type protein 1-like [Tripterygium wilfordii]